MGFYVKGRPFAPDYDVSGRDVIDAVIKDSPNITRADHIIVGNELISQSELLNKRVPAHTPIYWPSTNIEQGF
ncbi:MAG: hypothetical protein KAZ14_00565 [Nitrosomonas sp.]|nr:hypothetical protein [Nitrosomonas sp.]